MSTLVSVAHQYQFFLIKLNPLFVLLEIIIIIWREKPAKSKSGNSFILFCVPSKGLQSEINSKLFSDLVGFIKRAHIGKSVERIKNTVIHEIPTAALITGYLLWFQCILPLYFPFTFVHSGWDKVLEYTDVGYIFVGVNMPDHDVIFSQLATELKDQVTPFVAVLTSKDCAGGRL